MGSNFQKLKKFLLLLFLSILLTPSPAPAEKPLHYKPTVHFFWGKGCPHCTKEKVFLEGLKKKYPNLSVNSYEVWHNRENAKRLAGVANAIGIKAISVPTTFAGDEVFVGFSGDTAKRMESAIKRCSSSPCPDLLEKVAEGIRQAEGAVSIPLIGRINISDFSLPALTVIIGGLDSFNPCAFFVLFFLLSLLIHARSRGRMLLIGGTFVFFSGFIYFLFMAAWLNIFLLTGQTGLITFAAGAVALFVAVVNVKDFFFFKRGVSLSIPEGAKPKLFERMRSLLKATSLSSMMAGTVVLAAAANLYELLCTAGFPMVFTRILTFSKLPAYKYYIYLAFYNVVYVVPLTVIVLVFSATLGARKLTEWQGRKLKLLSGLMMLGLALVLLIRPELLNNVLMGLALLSGALTASVIIIFLVKKLNPDYAKI